MELLCIGHAALDLILEADGYPAEGTKALATRRSLSGGGPAANAAALAASWGVDAGFAGAVGIDELGTLLLEELAAGGVDVGGVARQVNYPTPLSSIVVNRTNGSRTIVNHREVEDVFRLPDGFPLAPPRLLLFDGHAHSASLEAMRRFPHASSLLDAGSLRSATWELAARVDYLVASETFAEGALGRPLAGQKDQSDALDLLISRQGGGGATVITLGERGGIWACRDERGEYAALPVTAVDTTAAGDVFHGAFAYGLLQGWQLEQIVAFAAVAAGLSVTRPGGRDSFPVLATVLERLHSKG